MRYRLILKEDAKRDREYQLCLSVIDQLTPQEKKWVMPNGRFVNSPRLIYRQVITVSNEPDRGAAFLDLYPYNDSKTAFLVYAVAPQFQRKGLGTMMVCNAIVWCAKNGYTKMMWRCDKDNLPSLNNAKKFGFNMREKKSCWVGIRSIKEMFPQAKYILGDMYQESYLREDLGNTPKGYKDINKIMDHCNEWFENNPDKADKVIWKRYIQVRNWIRELKKYRSKFGPITFERKLDDIKLNKDKKGKDGHITLDKAILKFFKKWKLNKYNMEDLNRTIMYCLIELRAYRKKFKKQDFSCRPY